MRILYRQHADDRRDEEEITYEEVRQVLRAGLVLRRYPEDEPYESRLVLGWVDGPARLGTYDRGRPIHVVAADTPKGITWIITVYEPDPTLWEDAFRWKKTWTDTTNTWRS